MPEPHPQAVSNSRARRLQGPRRAQRRRERQDRIGHPRRGATQSGTATAYATSRVLQQTAAAAREGVEVFGEPGLSPEEECGRAEMNARVREVVARLPERQRALVERVYFAGMTIEEASAAEGIHKSWGSRLHAQAME
jgi:RNA polymerase sigma factor (sigma-70 family)